MVFNTCYGDLFSFLKRPELWTSIDLNSIIIIIIIVVVVVYKLN